MTAKGEEKDVTINFPEDYPDASIAGKTIVFHVTVKEIREKRLPELNDEFAKDLSFENVAAMKDGIRDELTKEKEGIERRSVTQQLVKALTDKIDIPVPERYLEKRTDGMVEEAKNRFKGQGQRLSDNEEKALDENLRKEFAPRAKDRVKAEMILSKIAEKEGITVSDDEVEEKIKKFAEEARRTYNEVRGFYEEYSLMGGLRHSIMEEKAVDFLREHAAVKEKE